MSETTPSPAARRGRKRHETPSAEYLARRDVIVEVAAKVFGERGYDAGSLDDVAAAMGLRRASLYHYVGSKAELLYLIFDRALATAMSRVESLRSIDDPRQRLSELVRIQATTVASEPSFFAVFFEQSHRLDEAYASHIREKEREYFRVFVDAVGAAVAAGVIAPVDPRIGAHAILGMTNWTYQWIDEASDQPAEIAAACVALLFGPQGFSSGGR